MTSGRRIALCCVAVALGAAGCASSGSATEVRGTAETTPTPPTTSAPPVTTTLPSTTAAVPARLPPEPLVAMVGDSITVQAADALAAVIDGTTVIEAETRARIIDMTDRARGLAQLDPDVVVVNLGTNDEACATVGGCSDGYNPSADDVDANLRRVIDLFDDACRIGVTITYRGNDPALVNPALTTMVDDGTLAGVADWTAHRDRSEPPDDPWLIDFLGHLTDAGRPALAELVAAEITTACSG